MSASSSRSPSPRPLLPPADAARPGAGPPPKRRFSVSARALRESLQPPPRGPSASACPTPAHAAQPTADTQPSQLADEPAPPLPDAATDAVRLALLDFPPTAVRLPRTAQPAFLRLLRGLLADANARPPTPTGRLPIAYALRLAIPAGATARHLCQRISLAIEGRWDELAKMQLISHRRSLPDAPSRGAKARHYMLAGNKRKAWNALAATPIAIRDYEGEVARLFPAEPSGAAPLPAAPPPPFPTDTALADFLASRKSKLEDEVAAAIRHIPPLSQPGPSGLRGEHLRLALAADPAFLPLFTSAIRRAITGRLRGPTLTQSTLSLVPKPNGGARPIGVGEVIRRIAGRIVLLGIVPTVCPQLEADGQRALSRHGAALTYRGVVNDADAGLWVLQLDISNAFNTLTRAAVLADAPTHPLAAPLIHNLYRHPAPLVVPRMGETIDVTRGVTQGCPLGSLLFATALAPITREAALGLAVRQHWYADDGHITASTPDALDGYLERFTRLAAARGLTIGVGAGKSCILPPSPTAIIRANAHPHLARLPTATTLVSLGGPVVAAGHPDRGTTLDKAWEATVARTEDTVRVAEHVIDPQHLISLLASGGPWSRIRYHVAARLSPLPAALAVRLDTFQLALVADALGDGLGPHLLADVSASQTRLTLPHALGGLGLASVAAEAPVVAPHDRRILAALAAGDTATAAAVVDDRDTARHTTHLARQRAVRAILTPAGLALLAEFTDGDADTVFGLTATPTNGTLLSPLQAKIFLAITLGLPLFAADHHCPHCPGAPTSDPYGHHHLQCRSLLTPRHHRIRDAIVGTLRRALPGASLLIERALDATGQPVPAGTGARPVDLAVYSASANKWLVFDVVVKGALSQLPSTPINPPPAGPIARRAPPPRASPMAARARADKVARQRLSGDTRVTPMAFGPCGGVDGGTRSALYTLARLTDHSAVPVTYRALLGRVQMALWSSTTAIIARQMTKSVPGRQPVGPQKRGRVTNHNFSAHPPPLRHRTPTGSSTPVPQPAIGAIVAIPPSTSSIKPPTRPQSEFGSVFPQGNPISVLPSILDSSSDLSTHAVPPPSRPRAGQRAESVRPSCIVPSSSASPRPHKGTVFSGTAGFFDVPRRSSSSDSAVT